LRIDRERRTNLKTRARKPAKKPAAKKPSAKKPSAQKANAKKASVKKTPAKKAVSAKKTAPKKVAQRDIEVLSRVLESLDDDKAEEIVTIDLEGRSSLCDAIVIANGRSSRHVASIADHLARRLKEAGYGTRPVDGMAQGDWVLVDAGDVIVHIFRPEVRAYYDLEGMWSVDEPARARAATR
jgi:ribosome-associated protein